MKAIVFHGVGDIRLDDVPEPRIEDAIDAIIRITASFSVSGFIVFVGGVFHHVSEHIL